MYRSLLALATFVAVALAADNPNPFNVPEGFALTAGEPTTLKWKPTTAGTVTLQLRQGSSNDLNKGTTIKSGIPNSGSYTYTPDPNTVRGSDYTIEIISDTDPTATNYSPYFVLESSNTVASQTADTASASGTPSPSSASGSTAAASTASNSAAATTSSSAIGSTSSSAGSTSSSAATSTNAAASSSGASPSASTTSAAARSSVAEASAAASSIAAGGASSGQPSSPAILGAVPAWKIQGGLFAVLLGVMAT